MFFLAIRHLLARKKQTIITLSGVMLGVTAFITFSGIMTGFQDFIIDQLVNNDSHVRITAREETIEEHSLDLNFFPQEKYVFWLTPPSGKKENARIIHPLGWFQRLKADPRVIGYSPQLVTNALFTRGGNSVSGRITGIDPNLQIHITNIENYMKVGKFLDLGRSGQKIIIGDELMKKLGARFGDSIFLSTGRGPTLPFKIIGNFHLGVTGLDNAMGFAPLVDVQSLNNTPSQISDIAIRLTDVEYARNFANSYALYSQEKVQSWDQSNANILSVFSIQNFIKSFVTISIMIVAAFGIYNILNILVNQKRKDIGILRSVGFESSDIVHLFLIQGLILGITGGILGLFIGKIMSLYIETLHIGGMTDRMIVNHSAKVYISGLIMAITSSAISSVLPAISAGKLKPIDIVRSGE